MGKGGREVAWVPPYIVVVVVSGVATFLFVYAILILRRDILLRLCRGNLCFLVLDNCIVYISNWLQPTKYWLVRFPIRIISAICLGSRNVFFHIVKI